MVHKINLLIITTVALILGWQLLRVGYYPMHDDLQVMRVFEMRNCLNDGQIPCRWAMNMGDNYGQPMFNYYSAFPYYLGGLVNLLGFSAVDTVKILFLLSLIVSGIGMYFLMSFWVIPVASLIAAVAFMAVPYHALDIFVRGALSEVWGLSLLPFVLGGIVYLQKRQTWARLVFLALTLAAFLTTHNITSLLSTPLILIFGLFNLFLAKNKKQFFLFSLIGALLGIGLSAFFTLPLLLERTLIEQQGLISDYFNFHAHFTTLNQLFINTKWGYGPSKFGPDDDISFFLGIVQIGALILSPLIVWFSFKKEKYLGILAVIFTGVTFLGMFLTHGKSVLIWDTFKFLAFVQFPWRLLGMFIFGSAVLIGLFINLLPKKITLYTAAVIGVLLIVFNFKYFNFEKYFYWIDDNQKLSGELYNLQVRAAMLDYLPIGAEVPIDKAASGPVIKSGRAEVNYFDKRSNYFASEFDVQEEAVIEFPVMNFPNWTLYHNRKDIPFEFTDKNKLHAITIKLDKGHHLVQAWFEDTLIRKIGNVVSFISLLIVLIGFTLTYAKREK